MHCSLFKVKKDDCFPIAALLKIAHAIPHVGLHLNKRTFLQSVRDNANKQKKTNSCSSCIYTNTHIYTELLLILSLL